MDKIRLHGKVFRPYILHSELVAAAEKVAERLNNDYGSEKYPPILLCTLNGALPFAAELMKHLTFHNELASIKVTSYSGTESKGSISQIFGPTSDVAGRRVIIIEDIVDTGITLRYLRNMLLEKGAKDVRIATLFFKPASFSSRLVSDGIVPENADAGVVAAFEPEYPGITIQNDFIVGFGLDYNYIGRHYPDVYVLDEQPSPTCPTECENS